MTRFVVLALATMPLLGGAAPVPVPVPVPGSVPTPELAPSMVDLHNRARREVGVPPVAWDPVLAAQAQDWADHLARLGRLEHARGTDGENLASGSGGFAPADLAQLWMGEKANFINGVMPGISRTGQWWDAGHYSQVIWRDTTRIGCAVADSDSGGAAGDVYLVCRYAPAGNVLGERAY